VAITTVVVTGTYRTPQGEPLQGKITFTPAAYFTDTEDKVIRPPIPRTAKLDEDGHFAIALPVADDPDADPGQFFYKVRERLYSDGHWTDRNYSITLLAEYGSIVDISLFLPDPSAATETTVVQLTGEPGPTGDKGATGATGPQGDQRAFFQAPNMIEKIDNGYCVPARSNGWANVSGTSGTLRMTSFMVPSNITCAYLQVATTNNVPASGVTMGKLGIYSKDAVGDGWTLIASTANTTTLKTVGSSLHKVALITPVALVPDKLYAAAEIIVASTAAASYGMTGISSADAGITPQKSFFAAGQTDLPSTITPSLSTFATNFQILSA
jgi:hypothetical protein